MKKMKTIIKQATWIGHKTTDLSWTIGLTTAIIIAPAILAHTPANQMVTGTIVNALLFLAAYRLPFINTLLIAVLPSLVALMRGLLPAPMVLLIPYIVASNILLISIFQLFKKNPLQGIIWSSLVKFGFLYSITFLLAQKLSSPLTMMFQWPQLITALVGGTVFLSLKRMMKSN